MAGICNFEPKEKEYDKDGASVLLLIKPHATQKNFNRAFDVRYIN